MALNENDVNATLMPWNHIRASDLPAETCAVLVCNAAARARLYVNDTIACDHAHLAKDANALIAAFERGEIDGGWGDHGDGNFGTVITTREAARSAGVEGWPSPPRNGE